MILERLDSSLLILSSQQFWIFSDARAMHPATLPHTSFEFESVACNQNQEKFLSSFKNSSVASSDTCSTGSNESISKPSLTRLLILHKLCSLIEKQP